MAARAGNDQTEHEKTRNADMKSLTFSKRRLSYLYGYEKKSEEK